MSDYLDGLKKLRDEIQLSGFCTRIDYQRLLNLLIAEEEQRTPNDPPPGSIGIKNERTGKIEWRPRGEPPQAKPECTCTPAGIDPDCEWEGHNTPDTPQAKPDRAYLIAEKYFGECDINRCATAIRQREAELRTEMHRRLREVAERVWKTSDLGGNAYLKILAELAAEEKGGGK